MEINNLKPQLNKNIQNMDTDTNINVNQNMVSPININFVDPKSNNSIPRTSISNKTV